MARQQAAGDGEDGEEVTIEALTPALAQELLEANIDNRVPNSPAVENLARLMEEGKWRFNGDAIRISKTGRLLDGQHRCLAVVRAGVIIPKQVFIRGLEDESQGTMDQGRKRTAADVLAMSKIGNGNQIASVARLVHDWKRGKRSIAELTKGSRNQLTNDEIRVWAQQDENLSKAAAFSVRTSMRALATQKATGTLWFLCNEADPVKAEEFFDLLESGAGLEKGNPILTVRNYWSNLRYTGHVPVARYLDAGIRAWNRWMTGDTLSMISQRLERDIPDVYVPPGRADVVNRYPDDQPPAMGGLSLVPNPDGPPTAPEVKAPAKPKRKISAPGGDGTLFRER